MFDRAFATELARQLRATDRRIEAHPRVLGCPPTATNNGRNLLGLKLKLARQLAACELPRREFTALGLEPATVTFVRELRA